MFGTDLAAEVAGKMTDFGNRPPFFVGLFVYTWTLSVNFYDMQSILWTYSLSQCHKNN